MSKKTKAEARAARAAAAVAARKRQERRRHILIAISVVAAMALIIGAGFLINTLRDDEQPEGLAATTAYDVSIGDDDAPHEIIVYEDFLCPICQGFEAASREKLARTAEEGNVYVSYRPFNLFSQDDDPRKEYSVASAAAFAVVLEQSGAEVAKEFHDLLYENQPSESGPFPDTDWFVDLAVEAGATEDQVRAGIENGDGEDWVEKATEEADGFGIDSTPTIYLDGKAYRDGRTFEQLADNLVSAVS
jgi:protein-disulfide isomerase